MTRMLVRYIMFVVAFTLSQFAVADETGGLMKLLNFLTAKDAIISQNIANSSTPGFLPKDVENIKTDGDDLAMLKTQPGHLGPGHEPKHFKIKPSEVVEMKQNGNGVSMTYELFKQKQVTSHINGLAEVYGKMKKMIIDAGTTPS